jgi:chitosanase
MLSDANTAVILQILQAIETGNAAGDYGLVSLMHDGAGDRLQVTLGIQFDEASGQLAKVLQAYCSAAPASQAAAALDAAIEKVNAFANSTATRLALDQPFQAILRSLGPDPIMQKVQDRLFESETLKPALAWFAGYGFTLPLSMLVIQDSFLQSGGISFSLRRRFAALPPISGGDEKTWVAQYVGARNDWLAASTNSAVRASRYRTLFLLKLISAGDWDLAAAEYVVNGVPVNVA